MKTFTPEFSVGSRQLAIGKAMALPAPTFPKFGTLGKFVVLTITVVFFNLNVQAQGLWTSGQGSDSVKTERFVYVNNSLRATGNATIKSSARIDSILSCWQAFVDDILSVGSNITVGGGLTVGGSGTVAGSFSIAQGLDVTGQTQTATLLVNQNSILGIAEAFKLTADSIVAGYLLASEIFAGTIDAGNLSVSGNSQLSKLTADSINTNYLSSTGLLNSINIVTGSINSGQYLLNGLPLTGSQWLSAGSNIYFQGGNVGIGTTIPAFPLEVHGNAAITGTVFAGSVAAQNNISIGQFRFINGAAQPGQADTIRTPADLQIQATGKMQLTTTETLRMQAAGTVEITSVSDTIKLAAGTVVVGQPPSPPAPPPPTPVALDVVGNVRASGSITASFATLDSVKTRRILLTDSIKIGNSMFVGGNQLGTNNHIYTDNGAMYIGARGTASQKPYVGISLFEPVTIGLPWEQFHLFSMDPMPRKLIVSSYSIDNFDYSPIPIPLEQGFRLENYYFTDFPGDFIPDQRSSWDFIPVTPVSSVARLDINSVISGSNIMSLTDDGNVGIGTTSPIYKLDVKGNIRIFDNNNYGWTIGQNGPPANSVVIGYETPSGWRAILRTDWNLTQIYPKTQFHDKVGIGTASPLSKLHIENNGNVRITLRDLSHPSGNYFQIEQDKDLVSFNDNGIKQIMSMNLTSGKVGIGTQTPDFKLDVCGIIRSTEWIVEPFNGCDFVFDENYKRMNYEEKEKWFKEKKHLPGIAPARETDANGMKAGETISGIIMNTEENSLDIIDLYKQIKELKKQNEMLQNKIREVEFRK